MLKLILSCEHAGNRVPAAYAKLFSGQARVLAGHRGWDPGSLSLGKTFQRRFRSTLLSTSCTRLLVEPNRSLGHPRLFSEFTSGLGQSEKQSLLDRYYHPHRNRLESWITDKTTAGHAVVHLSLHTFTPELNGETRAADVGLLYDPGRAREKNICDAWKKELAKLRPDLRVRRNYPYLGKADGLTTHLRKRIPDDLYAGIELEVNQIWLQTQRRNWLNLQNDLAETFADSLRLMSLC